MPKVTCLCGECRKCRHRKDQARSREKLKLQNKNRISVKIPKKVKIKKHQKYIIPSVELVYGKGNNWENKFEWMKERQKVKARLKWWEDHRMNIETIVEKIGSGMVLKVPKNDMREKGRMPMLVEGLSTQGQARRSLLLRWEEVDMILLDNRLYQKHRVILAKVEKEDMTNEGVVIKQGWKSKGWDGERFDYYRFVQ